MFLRLSSSALAICLVTAPAAFSLTPDEVWNGWVTYYNSMGYKLAEGSREQAGETLTVKDVVLTQEGASSKINMQLGQIVLQATGDGGVRTTLAETMPLRVEVTEDKEKPVLLDLTLKMPGASIVSTGDLDNRTDQMTAPTTTVTIDKIEVPAESRTLTNVATVTATDMVSETVTRGGKGYAGTSTIGKLDYVFDVAGKADEGTVKGKGSLEKLAVDADVVLPANGTIVNFEENLAKALNDGLAIKGKLTSGAGTHAFDYSAKAEDGAVSNGTISTTADSLTLAFDMSAKGVSYQGEGTNSDTSVTDSQFPAPITYKLDKGAFGIQLPVSKSDTPAPFNLTYVLSGLTLGDSLWNLADPEKKLPRVPANIDINLSGLAKLTGDLFDPDLIKDKAGPEENAAADKDAATATNPAGKPATDTAAAPEADAAASQTAEAEPTDDPMPFQPVELTINKFAIDAVGAKISAEGALKGAGGGTLETPVGTLNARMEGINKLIDTLVAMGLVKQDEVQGYRMMLAMFTKTTEGSDVMTSAIEFKEDGSVFANGQQIK